MSFPFKAIVLIGMAGIGKTHWAKFYGEEKSVSADNQIADTIFSQQAEGVASSSDRTEEKIDRLASFVGKFGAEKHGGLSRAEFFRRQKIYGEAEQHDLLTIREFPDAASIDAASPNAASLDAANTDNIFLYDTTGSFCEVVRKDDSHHNMIKNLPACIVYLACSEREEKVLLQRQVERPKPMVYDKAFFEITLEDYLEQRSLAEEDIVPDDFLRFVFPRAIAHRRPRYESLADVVVATNDLENLTPPSVPSLAEFPARFLELVERRCSR